MLAVFGKQRPPEQSRPAKKNRKSIFQEAVTKADESYVYEQLEPLFASVPHRHHARIQDHLLGNGENGIGCATYVVRA